MSSHSMADRMRDYFTRQLAWLESTCAELREFERDLESDEERVRDSNIRRAREAESLAAEFVALKKEWDACADIPADDRVEIRGMALATESRAREMTELVERGVVATRERSEGVQDELDGIRRGKDALEGYRQDDPGTRLDSNG